MPHGAHELTTMSHLIFILPCVSTCLLHHSIFMHFENMAPDDATECYVCMEPGGAMVQPCACNVHVHERCILESIRHRDKLNPIACAICKKVFPTTIQSRALTVRCNSHVLLVAFVACLLAALEAFLIVYVCSFGGNCLWESPLVVFGIIFVAFAFALVCSMLAFTWRMYCRSTHSCCWCAFHWLPVKQIITMHDGSTIAVTAKRSCTGVDVAAVGVG